MYMHNVVTIVQNVLRKMFMPSVVIQALKVGYVLLYTFFKSSFDIQ